MKGRYVVIGGGGFSAEPDNPLLDEYVISLAGIPKPSVLFLPTASDDDETYIYRFQRSMKRFTRRLAVLRLKDNDSLSATRLIMSHQIIYVGGGDPVRALAAWRRLNLGRALAEAVCQGAIYCGVSAGAAVLFQSALVRKPISHEPRYAPLVGLNQISCGFCAHFDREPRRQGQLRECLKAGSMPPTWALADGTALEFDAVGQLVRLVSSHPESRAWNISAKNGNYVEHVSVPEYLGPSSRLHHWIRRAAQQDREGILAAHNRSITTLARNDYTDEQIQAWTIRAYDEHEAARIAEEILQDSIWVIEDHGKILGYAHLKTPEEWSPKVYLQALYVTPEAAGQGQACKLMRLVERTAIQHGAPAVVLHSSKTALGFYQKLGYELIGPVDYQLVANVPLERWPMQKVLIAGHGNESNLQQPVLT